MAEGFPSTSVARRTRIVPMLMRLLGTASLLGALLATQAGALASGTDGVANITLVAAARGW